MSDPQKYRTKEEVEEYKDKDPINVVLNKILTNNWASEDQIKEINKKVKEEIDDCVTFAENSPYPNDSEVYEDIYVQEDYPFLTD
jgi:pyruvate dehydrogenase E1 component alpha subunit